MFALMQQPADTVESAAAVVKPQPEESIINPAEETVIVADSDDDEDWGAPMRGQALPLQSRGNASGDCPPEAAAHSTSREQQDTANAPDTVVTETAFDDDRPKVCCAIQTSHRILSRVWHCIQVDMCLHCSG